MPVSYREVKIDARQRLRGRKPSAFLVAAVYLLISCVISVLVYRLSGYSDYVDGVYKMCDDVMQNGAQPYMVPYPSVNPLGIVLSAALLLMSVVLEFGFEGCCLQFARREKAGVRDLFNGFNQFGRAVALMVLRTLIVCALSLLFVIPGVIAFYRYRTAVYVMLDHPEMNVFQCLAETARQTRGHKMEYFMLDLSFIAWLIVSYLVSYLVYVPVLDIWVSPYMGTARALYHDRLNGRYDPNAEPGGEDSVQ